MSTRSAIIAKIGEQYRGIYCHFDGYLDGVGEKLLNHYHDDEKIRRLISGGDASSLGERVEPVGPHSYEVPEKETTVFYGRDRGESGTEPKTGAVIEDVAGRIGHNGYVYVYEDGLWTVNGRDLASEVQREKEENVS